VANNPIPIVYVASGLRTGGAEMALLRLIQHMDLRSFPTLVVSLRAGGEVARRLRSMGGVELIEIEGQSTLQSIRNWRQAVRRVKELAPKVIHGWMYDGNIAAAYLHRTLPNKVQLAWNIRGSVTQLRDYSLRLRCAILLNALYSGRPNVIVFNSHAAVVQHERLHFKSADIAVIANGLDLRSYVTIDPQTRSKMRALLGFSAATTVVCLLARFHPMKDHANFLKAASRLRDTTASFLLVGPGVDSNEPEIARQILSLGLQGRVTCLGERHDIPAILAACDVLCLSSAWGEGWPNAIAEGMASGLPCVTTDVGDSAMLLGDTGIVVPPCDSQALAQGLREILELTQETRIELGQKARERISNKYSVERMVRNYVDLYQRLIASDVP
jgi:glycosyltransferase involved in cell wall biosynthesis